jgi:hypothetical protein
LQPKTTFATEQFITQQHSRLLKGRRRPAADIIFIRPVIEQQTSCGLIIINCFDFVSSLFVAKPAVKPTTRRRIRIISILRTISSR